MTWRNNNKKYTENIAIENYVTFSIFSASNIAVWSKILLLARIKKKLHELKKRKNQFSINRRSFSIRNFVRKTIKLRSLLSRQSKSSPSVTSSRARHDTTWQRDSKSKGEISETQCLSALGDRRWPDFRDFDGRSREKRFDGPFHKGDAAVSCLDFVSPLPWRGEIE